MYCRSMAGPGPNKGRPLPPQSPLISFLFVVYFGAMAGSINKIFRKNRNRKMKESVHNTLILKLNIAWKNISNDPVRRRMTRISKNLILSPLTMIYSKIFSNEN